MAADREFTDSGILFKNDKKGNEKAPDFKGNVDLTCESCGHQSHRPLAAWARTGRNGSKFLSVSLKPKSASSQSKAPAGDDLDDILS
jgi:uncharacterized protein (DUF736 family)